jgi:hypothetical protein
VSLSGPDPLEVGPADVVLVAEEPGVGYGTALAGLDGPDPGPDLARATAGEPGAKVKAGGHPTPLWVVAAPEDRCAYVGEARAMWLYAIAWPARAGYVLAESLTLSDLAEVMPAELVFGAPNGRLSPHRSEE